MPLYYDVSIAWYHNREARARTIALCATLAQAMTCLHEQQQRDTSDVVTLTPLRIAPPEPGRPQQPRASVRKRRRGCVIVPCSLSALP